MIRSSTVEREHEALDLAASLVAASLSTGNESFAERLAIAFAWLGFLPADQREQFASEIVEVSRACTSISNFDRLFVVLADWKGTAETIALGVATLELGADSIEPGVAGDVPVDFVCGAAKEEVDIAAPPCLDDTRGLGTQDATGLAMVIDDAGSGFVDASPLPIFARVHRDEGVGQLLGVEGEDLFGVILDAEFGEEGDGDFLGPPGGTIRDAPPENAAMWWYRPSDEGAARIAVAQ